MMTTSRSRITSSLCAVALFPFLGLFSVDSFACSCARVSLETRFNSADNVFTAVVLDEYVEGEGVLGSTRRSVVLVTESLKGTQPFSVLSSGTNEGLCGIDLDVGSEYLFFAPDSGQIGLCLGIQKVNQAVDQLAAVRSYVSGKNTDLAEPWSFLSFETGCRLSTSFEADYSFGEEQQFSRILNGTVSFSHDVRPFQERVESAEPRSQISIQTPIPLAEIGGSEQSVMVVQIGSETEVATWTPDQVLEVSNPDGSTREIRIPDSYLLRGNTVIDLVEQLASGSEMRIQVAAAGISPGLDVGIRTTNLGDAAAKMLDCMSTYY